MQCCGHSTAFSLTLTETQWCMWAHAWVGVRTVRSPHGFQWLRISDAQADIFFCWWWGFLSLFAWFACPFCRAVQFGTTSSAHTPCSPEFPLLWKLIVNVLTEHKAPQSLPLLGPKCWLVLPRLAISQVHLPWIQLLPSNLSAYQHWFI